ncbi:hypothetical protein WKI68_02655 [Streptomyces sp. MS1.HAVA.3]|uniref:Uncharacterized protein n=1 Tax=Streptomyces caledonius TaxID=3134107 RepID=A0ABU8TYY1_9ACTN
MTHTNDPSTSRGRNILALIGAVVTGAVSGSVRAIVAWLLDR